MVVLDALTYAGNPQTWPMSWTASSSCTADIGASTGELLDAHGTDVVVNFAAESHDSRAVIDPSPFFRTNVLGTQTLLEAASTRASTRFHHISTCEVYGDLPLDGGEPFTEESPYRPRTPYNASKAGADHAVRAYK